MRLFPATLTLIGDLNSPRSVRYALEGLPHAMVLTLVNREITLSVEGFKENEPSEETECLAALVALTEQIAACWVDPEMKQEEDLLSAHYALGSAFGDIQRMVEYLPRTAETTLEIFLRASLTGLPVQVAMVMLAPSDAELVMAEGELEREIRERHIAQGLSSLTATQAIAECPPLQRQAVFPAVPEEAKAAFQRREAAWRLKHAASEGSA